MFHEVVAEGATGPERDTGEMTAATLLASFETLVSEAVAEAGRDRIAEETGIDGERLAAAAAGDVEGLRLEDGVAIVAVPTDRDGDVLVAEVRDHLLMGMATAVLDVDTIAAAIDADLTGQEVQQALEGRAAMTLGQLAEIMAVIERRKP
ncbi:DUF5791 family protein [Halorubrum lipolyticum]|uniref:Uncharacterized protein n=1 Tax=Halorubrum lipolyticum DSM 21995 TaxID=1227482 RepID=M0NT82_9EURY|nr:DUF5791 family protein [Halorubrum lipolyticum]EMA61157.1 hypothetical protein C469_07797 [Halorubrum lipolyticum DSM 21995]